MENDEINKTASTSNKSFDVLSNNSFVTDRIYPTSKSSTSSHSFVSNPQINDFQTDNSQEDAKPSNHNVKKPLISIAAALLCGVGILMIIQYIFIIIVLIIGNLSITVNPDTGEKINGPENIIPSIMGEWKSFLIFVVGIVCLYISYKAFKSNTANTHKKSGARIETMEEEKGAVYKSVNSNSEKE